MGKRRTKQISTEYEAKKNAGRAKKQRQERGDKKQWQSRKELNG